MIHVGQCAWSIIEQYINIMVHESMEQRPSCMNANGSTTAMLYQDGISQMQHIVFRLENPRMYPAHHLKLSLSGPHRCTTSSAAWLWSRFLNGSYRAYPEVLIIHLPSWHSLCPSQSWDLKALFHLKQATTTWINSLPLNSTGQMRRFWVSWHVVLSFCPIGFHHPWPTPLGQD